MRIIAGEYRRRNLYSPPGMTTRPIPDRVKESLFSALGLRVQGATFLDCFAGSGAIGLEALSRGAASCLFVEKDRHSADTLERNIKLLGDTCEERSTLVRGDALGLSVVARCPRPLDLAFFDPPYPLIETRIGWERMIRQCSAVAELLADNGFLMLRTPLPHMITDETVGGEGDAVDERLKARRFKRHDKPRSNRLDDQGGREQRAGRGVVKKVEIGGELVEPLSEEEIEELMEGGGAKGKGLEHRPAKGIFAKNLTDVGEGEAARGAHPKAPAVFADWRIPGTRGPETHEYGTMAVHFYMKA